MLNLTPYGTKAWLVRDLDHTALRNLAHGLDKNSPKHYQEYTLGYDSLLLQFTEPVSEDLVREQLESIQYSSQATTSTHHHEIRVVYDGPDLEDTAKALRLSCAELVALHTSPLYQVRFLGFSPGFPYLDGLPERIHLPRRNTPRTRMQSGAVAIGGGHASIYTIPSPGGWHWLGNTDYPIFDRSKDDDSAFTLKPGDTLKFIPKDD